MKKEKSIFLTNFDKVVERLKLNWNIDDYKCFNEEKACIVIIETKNFKYLFYITRRRITMNSLEKVMNGSNIKLKQSWKSKQKHIGEIEDIYSILEGYFIWMEEYDLGLNR